MFYRIFIMPTSSKRRRASANTVTDLTANRSLEPAPASVRATLLVRTPEETIPDFWAIEASKAGMKDIDEFLRHIAAYVQWSSVESQILQRERSPTFGE